jgi:hypothetical protein
VAGELPGDTFDLVMPSGQVIHVFVTVKDGQRYFGAWHREPKWYWGFLGRESVVVEDIPVGTVPAYHDFVGPVRMAAPDGGPPPVRIVTNGGLLPFAVPIYAEQVP